MKANSESTKTTIKGHKAALRKGRKNSEEARHPEGTLNVPSKREKDVSEQVSEVSEVSESKGTFGRLSDHRKSFKKEVVELDGKKVTKVDCGDETASRLRGLHLEDVYVFASQAIGVAVEDLVAKYGHLNPGQQRMNLGNRIRAALKKRHQG